MTHHVTDHLTFGLRKMKVKVHMVQKSRKSRKNVPWDKSSHKPFKLAPNKNPALRIFNVLDLQKISYCYEYLVQFHNTNTLEESWVPLAEIPILLNEVMDQYHCRHPCTPQPPQDALDKQ
jgi:hypothetical protein